MHNHSRVTIITTVQLSKAIRAGNFEILKFEFVPEFLSKLIRPHFYSNKNLTVPRTRYNYLLATEDLDSLREAERLRLASICFLSLASF